MLKNKAFFNKFNNLKDAINATFTRKLNENPSTAQIVIFYLGRLCVEDFFEILILCGNGKGIGALKTIRGMFEKAVNAEYLASNESLAQDYLDFYWISQNKILSIIESTFGLEEFNEEDIKTIVANYGIIKKKFQITVCKKCKTRKDSISWSKLDLISMAKTTKGLKGLIIPGYYAPTVHIHSNPSGLIQFIKEFENSISFTDKQQEEQVQSSFLVTHNILLEVLKLQAKYFNLIAVKKKLRICKKDFCNIWNKDKINPN